MAGFRYTCPRCGQSVKLRDRVVLNKRKCSYCGEPITVDEIDRQEDDRRWREEQNRRRFARDEQERQRVAFRRKVLSLGAFVTLCLIAFVLMKIADQKDGNSHREDKNDRQDKQDKPLAKGND